MEHLFRASRATRQQKQKNWTIAHHSRDIQVKNIGNVVDIALKMRQCNIILRIVDDARVFDVVRPECGIVQETNWKEWCEEHELANE